MMGTRVKVLDYNSSVQIVFQDTSLLFFESHPIHLHGQNFYIVGSGFGTYNPSTDPANFNLVDPSCFETHLCCSSRAIRSISMGSTSLWLVKVRETITIKRTQLYSILWILKNETRSMFPRGGGWLCDFERTTQVRAIQYNECLCICSDAHPNYVLSLTNHVDSNMFSWICGYI